MEVDNYAKDQGGKQQHKSTQFLQKSMQLLP